MVNAVEDALRGRDCVKIADGDFTLIAGGDGIKSNKDTKATKGFVSIDGGTFVIEAGDDGIHAQTYLRIAGGDISIAAVDDALHSNLEACWRAARSISKRATMPSMSRRSSSSTTAR